MPLFGCDSQRYRCVHVTVFDRRNLPFPDDSAFRPCWWKIQTRDALESTVEATVVVARFRRSYQLCTSTVTDYYYLERDKLSASPAQHGFTRVFAACRRVSGRI